MNILENSMIEEFSKNFSKKINKILLAVHLFLLIFFCIFHIYIMVAMNVLSILVYLLMFWVVQKKTHVYLKVTYIEIVIHMTTAIICLGWEYGFQLYCFALIPMVFYAEYLGRKSDGTKFYPRTISVGLMFLFICLKLYISVNSPIYMLNNNFVSNLLFVFNSSMIGAFVIYFMSLYNKISLKSEKIMRDYAQKDALTGLRNKAWLFQIKQSFFEDIVKNRENLMIAILDIDDFKKLNDTYGHQFGDKVLFHIATQLKYLEKNGYYVCRWGGEEFLVFGVGTHVFEDSIIRFERLIQKISDTEFLYQRKKIKVTVTVGLAKRTDEANFDLLMKKADENLYIGKRSGKNRVQYEEKISQ